MIPSHSFLQDDIDLMPFKHIYSDLLEFYAPAHCVCETVKLLYTKKSTLYYAVFMAYEPRAGSGIVRIDPLHFLTVCRTRRLNQV